MGKERKAALKSKGMAMTVILFIFIFICIFLAGFDYRQTLHRWTDESPYRVIGAVQITLVVVAFVIVLLSFAVFSCCSDSKGLIILFIGFNGLSLLFTMSISFFTLIAGSTGKLNKYVGCQTEFKGILKYWDDIDNYLQTVDKYFCKEKDSNDISCQCTLTKYTDKIFKDDPIIGPLYKSLYRDNKEIEVVDINAYDRDTAKYSWRKCSEKVLKNGTYGIVMRNIGDFQPKIFNRFWEHIENKFDCTGFCSTVYQRDTPFPNTKPDDKFNEAPLQIPMFKYLFSDINRGIPKHRGCMKPIMDWLPKMLISFGSFALFAALVQFALFCLSISLLGASGEEDAKPQSQVYQKQDENKQLKEEERK